MPNFTLGRQEDIPYIVSILREFFKETPYKDKEFNEAKVTKVIEDIHSDPYGFILLDKEEDVIKGLLIAKAAEFIFSNGKFATEFAWYVLPEYRSKGDAKAWNEVYEFWAKELGCLSVSLMNFNDERLDKMYTKMGYVCKEHTYMKDL